MIYRMLKLSNNGPMIMARKDSEYNYQWFNPVVVYEEDGKYHLGNFIDVADIHSPFVFNNIEFECTPVEELIVTYNEFMDDYFPEVQ